VGDRIDKNDERFGKNYSERTKRSTLFSGKSLRSSEMSWKMKIILRKNYS
jgi:hypothetical protein